MVSRALFDYGMGADLDFAGNDRYDFRAWNVVCFGGGIVIFNRCDILFVAAYEICTCTLAPVCNRGQCLFLFCGVVRFYNRFCREVFGIKKQQLYLDFVKKDGIIAGLLHVIYKNKGLYYEKRNSS